MQKFFRIIDTEPTRRFKRVKSDLRRFWDRVEAEDRQALIDIYGPDPENHPDLFSTDTEREVRKSIVRDNITTNPRMLNPMWTPVKPERTTYTR